MAWMAAMSGTLAGCLASGGTGSPSAACSPTSSRRPTRSLSKALPMAFAFCCSSSAMVRK
eukprot:12607301-Alexandrium_andersonii.AAC.1